MDLWTSYVFPHPQKYNTLGHPSFLGLANFKFGNFTLNTFNIDLNLSFGSYPILNSAQISSFVNSQFNSFVGSHYNNLFSSTEHNLINSIDPTYLTTYAAYTKKVNTLDNANRFKMVLGKAEKVQGYSSSNDWTFDWNIGFGGAQYTYDMKSGSFFGRARVGSNWYAIRTVRQ